MKIEEAFKLLIDDEEKCDVTGISRANRKKMKSRLNNTDPSLTLQTMTQWLEKAGWTYTMIWHKPK